MITNNPKLLSLKVLKITHISYSGFKAAFTAFAYKERLVFTHTHTHTAVDYGAYK